MKKLIIITVKWFGGAISRKIKSEIFIFGDYERENEDNYKNILKNYLIPWTNKEFPGKFCAYYNDNATPHKGKAISEWMHENLPYVVDAPPYSPDLNDMGNAEK